MDSVKPAVQRPTLWLLVTGVVLLGVSGFFYRNVEQFAASDRAIRHTHRVIVAITRAVSSLREAESVQRGYLVTGDISYLRPYGALIKDVDKNWAELKALTRDSSDQQQRIARLEPLLSEKLADLDLTIGVRRDQDFAAAQRLMMNNYGKDVMDIIRAEVDGMLAEEERLMNLRNEAGERAHQISIGTILIFLASGLLLALISARLIRHSQRLREAGETARRRHHAQLDEKIAQRTAQVRQLAGHLESVREEEKRAIARELHDDIGSSMTALSMVLEGHFRQNADNPGVARNADKIRALLKEVTHSTRRIQAGLRPNTLDSLGLIEAIRELVGEFAQRTSLATTVHLPDSEVVVPAALHVPLFRMLQEALNNVAKHAQARSVEVTLALTGDNVMLEIEDDGIGIPRERADNTQTHGLLGMRERAAYLDGIADIRARSGGGTIVSIQLPVAAATGVAIDVSLPVESDSAATQEALR
jgi:signal transduction histidine kinase